jgi:hypothetical protein
MNTAPALSTTPFIRQLRDLAVRGLPLMYRPSEHVFAFRVRPGDGTLVLEGVSRRYTAISLIGLAGEPESTASSLLSGETARGLSERLLADVATWENLGDVALALWAARALGAGGADAALSRLVELQPAEKPYPTVEVAWALAALCMGSGTASSDLANRLAGRLVNSLSPNVWVFPHRLGGPAGRRAHVACFADLVYPVHALSHHHVRSGDPKSLVVASKAAEHFCRLQGKDGQWWWHYDTRTGDVIEGYPVYAVHQDAMAPMALLALVEAGGPDFSEPIAKGLRWLSSSPELGGRSLVDTDADVIWRKVARREPGKASRYLRAAATSLHPGARLSVLDTVFPPRSIDVEDRPYHLGWLLYAWTESRLSAWQQREASA